MGKKDKDHRAKVAKRNQRISQERSKMQRVFDRLIADQMDAYKQKDNLDVKVGDQPVKFEVIDPNDTTTN